MDARLRRLVSLSAVATGFLMLLGVYTAAAGAGLTCARQWPLCDGAVFGLFPATWGSFVEWFHRLAAMLTGFLILGTTVSAWRRGASRRVRYALALATLLLPSQIVLGALTVTEYELVILTAHFVTASTIFTAVVAAAAWSLGAGVDRLRRAVAVALVAMPAIAVLSPRTFLAYSATVQAAYYAIGLTAFAALVAATLWSGAVGARRVRPVVAAAAAGLLALLVVGRQAYAPEIGVVGALLVFAATGLGAYLAFDRDRAAADRHGVATGHSGD